LGGGGDLAGLDQTVRDPPRVYTDWKTVYVRRPNQEERATGAEPLSQFGRICATLDIKIIPASSPQAKGRIERNHGTHQDRLVKKLRRKHIGDVDAANAFLEREYWADHNRRFAQPPASADDFHVAVPRGVRLDQVFRLEETRTVSNDWVVRYDNRLFQLERQSGHPPARSTVVVYEASEGQIEICYRDRAEALDRRGAPGAHGRGRAAAIPWHSEPRGWRADPTANPGCGSSVAACGRTVPARSTTGGRSQSVRGGESVRTACGSCPSRGREEHAPPARWRTTEQFSTATTGIINKGTFLTS
jgi:hypothetical protein